MATMFSIVAQSILQFNQTECQGDYSASQIDVKRPRRMKLSPARPEMRDVLIRRILTATASASGGGCLLRFDVLVGL